VYISIYTDMYAVRYFVLVTPATLCWTLYSLVETLYPLVQLTDCGGNALLAYQTQFDMEDNFIIARGIGTAVTLDRESH